MVSTVSRKNPKKVIEVLAENGPLSKWQLKEKAKFEYPRVHEAVSKLENDGYLKVYDTMESDKGLTMKIYGLTFRGVMAYLTSLSLEAPPQIGEPGESIEAFKERYAKEKERYMKEVEQLARFLERYGKLLDYAIFKEVRWLAKRFRIHIYHDILDIAKLVDALQPFPSGAKQLIIQLQKEMNGLKKRRWQILRNPELQRKIKTSIIKERKTEETCYIDPLEEVNKDLEEVKERMEILLQKENEWWSRGFAAHFAERVQHLQGKGDMHNEPLHALFKQVAETIRKLEVEPAERMAETFSSPKA